ncbi:MAG: hypothetical protein AB8B71_20215 [Paracoccaceae bacterium]
MLKILKTVALKTAELSARLWQEIAETAVAIFEIRVDVITLQGQLRGGAEGENATLLYVGRNLNLPHFKKKYFVKAETVSSQKANLFTHRKYMKAAETAADVVFVDVGWPYNNRINKNGDYLELPDWVCLTTPLADSWDGTVQNFRKTMRKNIKRLIRKNEYRCETTNDPSVIKSFYDEFYKAFINSRHSGEVFMTPRISIEQRAREGTILRVIGKEGTVAAGVYFPQGDELCLLVTGMPEALVESPPEAAISALYFFSLQYAFENSYKAVNFMGTRAFPNDGLFQFKRKWGAEVRDTFSIDSILFKPMSKSAKAARFCELFPFIARKGKTLELVLCSTAPELNKESCNRLVATYHCNGLNPVRVVHATDQTAGAKHDYSEDDLKVEVFETPLASFAQTYTNAEQPRSRIDRSRHLNIGQHKVG